ERAERIDGQQHEETGDGVADDLTEQHDTRMIDGVPRGQKRPHHRVTSAQSQGPSRPVRSDCGGRVVRHAVHAAEQPDSPPQPEMSGHGGEYDRRDEAENDDRGPTDVEEGDVGHQLGHRERDVWQHLDGRQVDEKREQDEHHIDGPVLAPPAERAGQGDAGSGRDHHAAHDGTTGFRHDGVRSRSPSRTASSAALVRSFTWSFLKMLATWFFTVCSLMKSRFPISRFESPVARSFSISSSRAVSAESCSRWRSSWRSRSNSRSTRPAISPESIGSPAAARSTVARISSGGTFFGRYPTAPALSAAKTRSESENAVSITTRTSGCRSWRVRVSSMPFSPGSSTSISTSCGRPWERMARHISSPLPAVASTRSPRRASRHWRSPSRKTGWSSTISTLMLSGDTSRKYRASPCGRGIARSSPRRGPRVRVPSSQRKWAARPIVSGTGRSVGFTSRR